MTTRVEGAVTANVPAAVAYAQFFHVEEFPRFLPKVEHVACRGGERFSVRTRSGGDTREWEAEIVERMQDSLIVWRCAAGTPHAGVVTFASLPAGRCRVGLSIEFEPHGLRERLGVACGVPRREIAADLQRFADYLELRAVDEAAH
ncbi:MAG: SRPBCC family protein [Planctomycetes bacterium]|nr:SRPBCC family protein [Planctomycetota bacterium]